MIKFHNNLQSEGEENLDQVDRLVKGGHWIFLIIQDLFTNNFITHFPFTHNPEKLKELKSLNKRFQDKTKPPEPHPIKNHIRHPIKTTDFIKKIKSFAKYKNNKKKYMILLLNKIIMIDLQKACTIINGPQPPAIFIVGPIFLCCLTPHPPPLDKDGQE